MIISNLEILEVMSEDEIVGGRARAFSDASALATGRISSRTVTAVETDAFYDSSTATYNSSSIAGATSEADVDNI